jgi:hypothetical protein
VLIHPRGLFVFESKNYNGWIFGNEKNLYWTQTLPKGCGQESHKERFYRPIRKNGAHIKHLKRILSQNGPMWSLIIFSNECTHKDVTASPDKRHKVIQLHQLKSLASKVIKESPDDIFSISDVNWMCEELYPFTQEVKETKQQHLLSKESYATNYLSHRAPETLQRSIGVP